MRFLFAFAIILFFAGLAAALVYLNRGSEKLVTAVTPIAVAAIVAVFLTVFLFDEPPIDRSFPTAFMYRNDNKMSQLPEAAVISRSAAAQMSLFVPGLFQKKQPDAFKSSSEPDGTYLYHQLLQESIVESLSLTFSKGWRSSTKRFELPTALIQRLDSTYASSEKPNFVDSKGLTQIFPDNELVQVSNMGPRRIGLPPGAIMTSSIRKEANGSQRGQIKIHSFYCDLTIDTEMLQQSQGLGLYAPLFNISTEESNRYLTATYLVKIHARFRRFLSGNPVMIQYKEWATTVADSLAQDFDEQLVWKRTRERGPLEKVTIDRFLEEFQKQVKEQRDSVAAKKH